MGSVTEYLEDRIRRGPIHFTLIDPEKSSEDSAAAVASGAVELGSDAILLGGSTGISPDRMRATARAVKEAVSVPVIIFPEGPGSLADGPDAILFMSLLNSRNLDRVIRAHAQAAPIVRKLRLEPIPLGYLVIAPGMRVGEVGEADVIPRDGLRQAEGYALAAEFLGMRFVYLEAGSGAPTPVPPEMIRAVRSVLSIPLIVGGGIRSRHDAEPLLEAGAQALMTGTVTEQEGLGEGFHGILGAVRKRRGG